MRVISTYPRDGYFLKVHLSTLRQMTPTRAVVLEKILQMNDRDIEPTYNQLATDLGVPRPTIIRSMKWLFDNKYLVKSLAKGDQNDHPSMIKMITPSDQNDHPSHDQNDHPKVIKMISKSDHNDHLNENLPIVNKDNKDLHRSREASSQNDHSLENIIMSYQPPTDAERLDATSKMLDEAKRLSHAMNPHQALRILNTAWLQLWPGLAQATLANDRVTSKLSAVDSLGPKVCAMIVVWMANFPMEQAGEIREPTLNQGVYGFLQRESGIIQAAQNVFNEQKRQSEQKRTNKAFAFPMGNVDA